MVADTQLGQLFHMKQVISLLASKRLGFVPRYALCLSVVQNITREPSRDCDLCVIIRSRRQTLYRVFNHIFTRLKQNVVL